jgi:drug/metabolite transporter (DMT)-like permease
MTNLGELAALSCSLLWALCSLAFASAGRRVGATAVNQIRIYIALLALAGLHLLIRGELVPEAPSPRQLGLLLTSGVVGLAIGDYCLFRCMAVIGPRLGTLLMATSPLMTAAIAWFWFGEGIVALGLLGMGLTIAGVVGVLVDRRAVEGWRTASAGHRLVPVLLGLCGALGQAVGLILTKAGMGVAVAGEEAIPALSVTLIRMAAGAVSMSVFALAAGQSGAVLRACGQGRAMLEIAVGAVFGPILGVWMSVVAVEHAKAGVAATLMSLAPVLMLPIGRFAYGARPGPLGWLGTLVAVGGCALLFLRGGGSA